MELFLIIGVYIVALGILRGLSSGGEIVAEVNKKCRHGYENWDDCPDCCH